MIEKSRRPYSWSVGPWSNSLHNEMVRSASSCQFPNADPVTGVDGMQVFIKTFEGAALAIELPQRVTLEIVETEPVIKNQTASSSFKPATLNNGVKTMVPPHIGVGTRVVVLTDDGSYVERAKD